MKLVVVGIACCLLVALAISWHQEGALPSSGRLDAIFFETENYGFVRLCCPKRPITYETQDGGQSWHKVSDVRPHFRRGQAFVNSQRGFSVIEDAPPHKAIYVTEDAGKSWHEVLHSSHKGDFYFDYIQAVSETEVWAGSYHTSDGGRTWQLARAPGGLLYFLDREHGWSVGGDSMWRTKDAGQTWEKVGTLPGHASFELNDFYFLDAQRGWIVGGSQSGNLPEGDLVGVVFYTEDGGMTWKKQTIIGHYLWSVFFLKENIGWVAGTGGSFLKTEDGGRTWLSTKTGEYATVQNSAKP